MALDSTCRFKQYITCMYTSKCYRIKKHSCTVVPSYTTNVSLSLELELLKLKGTLPYSGATQPIPSSILLSIILVLRQTTKLNVRQQKTGSFPRRNIFIVFIDPMAFKIKPCDD